MSFLTDIFGKTKVEPQQVQYTPPGFNAGGLNASFRGNQYTVNPSADRTTGVVGISDLLNQQGDILSGLRQSVGPGFNALLQSRLAENSDTANRVIGDLRQNLQARRILGSSFGNDTLARANAEFGRQRDAIVADNFLKSVAATQEVLQQEYAAKVGSFQNLLNEMNLEANLAKGLTSEASGALAQNARVNASLAEQANEFNAKSSLTQLGGLGSLAGLALAPVTGGASLFGSIGSFFGGGSNPSSLAYGSNPFTPYGTRNPAYG